MNVVKIKHINLNEETAYLAGAIVGDGHISNSFRSKKDKSPNYRIYIELTNKPYLKYIVTLIKNLIFTKTEIKEKPRKEKRKNLFYFQVTNKSLYYFLTYHLGIPRGKKSDSVYIPKIIFSSEKLQKHFLAGLFDTDGGIRGDVIGFTSASKQLIKDISTILENLHIGHFEEKWFNKKYNRYYFGLKLKRKYIDKFLSEIPLKNKIKERKSRLHAGVPEWPNGTDSSQELV